jgi:hypothetical protein
MLTYDTPALRQTGSRNLTDQKMLPTIRGTYMKLVTKYQSKHLFQVKVSIEKIEKAVPHSPIYLQITTLVRFGHGLSLCCQLAIYIYVHV